MIERLRRMSYFLAYAAATIPLWYYIRDGRILALMVAMVTFAYVMVVLSSVQAAQPILSSEKAKTTLPRWLPDKPKYHKWWLLVRRTLKWHLLLVPPKMGLALGFVHQLFIKMLAIPAGQSYNYIAHNFGSYTLDLVPEVYPHWEFIGLTFITLLLFSILEAMLTASTCLITKKYHPQALKSATIIVLRAFLAFGFVGMVDIAVDIQRNSYEYQYQPCRRVVRHVNGNPVLIDEEWDIYDWIVDDQLECSRRRTFETITTASMTPFAQGTLLSANIMRPLLQYGEERGYSGSHPIGHPYRDKAWNNNLFVARQLVAAVLGLILYAGATWVILWFVEDEEDSQVVLN